MTRLALSCGTRAGRRASSAALTLGQMAARLNPPAPGVMLRLGRLPQREGGVASATVAGLDDAGGDCGEAEDCDDGAEGDADEAVALAVNWLPAGFVPEALVHPDAARAASRAAARIFLIPAVLSISLDDNYLTLREPDWCTRLGLRQA